MWSTHRCQVGTAILIEFSKKNFTDDTEEEEEDANNNNNPPNNY